MSKSYNKAMIIGRLGNSPSLYDTDGVCFTTFRLVNTYVDKQGDTAPEWHDIKAVGNQARICCQYLSKGDLCCIEGNVSDNYINVERITFLSSKKRAD